MKFLTKYKTIILSILIIISIGINIAAFLQPSPLISILHQILIEKDVTRVYLNTGLDEFLAENVLKGNLFLKFRGYDTSGKANDFITPNLIYMRAYYTLYPRETYVVKPDVVVNNGHDILADPFHPDKAWLQEHGVKKVVTFTFNAEYGTTAFNIETVSE